MPEEEKPWIDCPQCGGSGECVHCDGEGEDEKGEQCVYCDDGSCAYCIEGNVFGLEDQF